MPDRDWWEDRDRREREAPWIDAQWNAARSDLFLAALRLHKAFVIATAKKMRQSLHGAIDILDGSAPADLPPDAALAAWRSLFFVVPVLSTSFASFARVFSHLGRESLGWLFIDEAGQCTPQTPAGAIWRSRRVVVVGDPLQLQPVVTLPFTAQQAIRREHRVDETWLPSRASAQTLADRVSTIGTWRGSGSDAMWVGAPLNVHRRCEEPIFQIVNAIAYDGPMINATPTRADLKLPPSKWLDVASTQSDGHWIPAERERLSTILDHLDSQHHDFSEVFVLTPFRQVARHLYALRDRYPGITTGTVHTAQGREADIVILVLGGDPGRPRAKQWAADPPNLLNVAISRAKRRLYVIGDRAAWSQQPHFDVLADRLPTT
jgi:superfamily I DNA and/or RNA helicase